MESFWKEVKSQVKKSVPDHCYRMWIEPVALFDHGSDRITLSAPNAFFAKRLKENYQGCFEKEFLKLGQKLQIEFRTDTQTRSAQKKGKAKKVQGKEKKEQGAFAAKALVNPSIPMKQPMLPGIDATFNSGRMLKKTFTFDDFVVGDNSNFAYSASLSLAQGQSNGSGMLFLLSKTGLGKSHLSQAVGHHIIANSQAGRVFYVTAEDFTNEMIFSLRNNVIERFKEKYRQKCDVLILEDIHFLSGKTATQKELAMTLDYLLDADKKIIFSGCERPDDIPKLDENLKSRLNMGLVTEIQAPDFRTRIKILNKKSKGLGCALPMPVTEYIAQELCDDVRQLESGLFGVVAKGQLMGRNIDIKLAQSVLENMTRNRKSITIDLIKRLVCDEFSITEQDIVSKSRKRRIVKPRQVAMFLSKRYTDQPIKKIGSSFKRYHATAIYSVNAVEKELRQKGVLFEQINYLSKKLETGKF
ncbi:MAG: chromosomal replication initiator protein DnaA [Desulfobacter sp.]|nr:chromosomal replication initiator protein DnaA [Desulfobacter sp.]WDP86711.1 MAG: chromosomal replication initiator protein DnaA [Desulfobacter sp.]